MVVRDGTGKDTATMMSEQFMITPFSQKTVKLYWETETLIEGTYSAHLTLKSTSQTQGQDLILSVAKDKLDISRSVSPLTGQFSRAAEYPSKKSTIIMVSGGIGIFLIVIAVIILVMRRNSKKPL